MIDVKNKIIAEKDANEKICKVTYFSLSPGVRLIMRWMRNSSLVIWSLEKIKIF